jgi:hypothetical protein
MRVLSLFPAVDLSDANLLQSPCSDVFVLKQTFAAGTVSKNICFDIRLLHYKFPLLF